MEFYVLDRRNRFDDKFFAYGEQSEIQFETGETIDCEQCGLPISMREWLPPLRVNLSKPSYGDIVIGTFSPFLVSERFKTEYEKAGLKGIKEFKKVEIVKVKRKRATSSEPPNYYYVTIEIIKAKIDEVKSKAIRKMPPTCDLCGGRGKIKAFQGIYFIEETLGELDIFSTYEIHWLYFVSKKFHDFVMEHDFKNFRFVPATEYIEKE